VSPARSTAAMPNRDLSWWPTVVTGAVAVAAALLFAWLCDPVSEHNGITAHDPSILRDLTRHRDAVIDALARATTFLAGAPVVILVALGVGVYLWRRGIPLVWAVVPAGSVVVAALVATAGKHHFDRARPPLALRLVHESGPSFPSGHTTVGTAVAMAIGIVFATVVCRRTAARVAWLVAAALVSFAIGVGRLELGVHWPTDVVAGWAVGLAAAAACASGASIVVRVRRRGGRTSVPAARW
jgi:membrane-associated phospholipid phosphatase